MGLVPCTTAFHRHGQDRKRKSRDECVERFYLHSLRLMHLYWHVAMCAPGLIVAPGLTQLRGKGAGCKMPQACVRMDNLCLGPLVDVDYQDNIRWYVRCKAL